MKLVSIVIFFFFGIIWLKDYIYVLFGYLCSHFYVVKCQENIELLLAALFC